MTAYTEITDLYFTSAVHEHVGRFDVTVHNLMFLAEVAETWGTEINGVRQLPGRYPQRSRGTEVLIGKRGQMKMWALVRWGFRVVENVNPTELMVEVERQMSREGLRDFGGRTPAIRRPDGNTVGVLMQDPLRPARVAIHLTTMSSSPADLSVVTDPLPVFCHPQSRTSPEGVVDRCGRYGQDLSSWVCSFV